MRLYHRTDRESARAILGVGFVDGVGRDLLGKAYDGVWLLDRYAGRAGHSVALLAVDLHLAEQLLAEFESDVPGGAYRVFYIPAAILNAHATVQLVEDVPFPADTGR
jgi:hypothetical protein